MKFRYTCREAVDVMLAGQDRRLTLGERLVLRAHLLACRACPLFLKQLELMRLAMQRWREQPPP